MVTESLLGFAADNYGFDKSSPRFISGSTNQIYAFQKGANWYILRFSQRPADSVGQTEAEMDWLYYLAKNNINVSLPLAANDGRLVISTEEEGNFYVISAFEALSGKFWNKNDPELWNGGIFYNWGKLTGEIHSLTKKYAPPGAGGDDNRDGGGVGGVSGRDENYAESIRGGINNGIVSRRRSRKEFDGHDSLFMDKFQDCPSVYRIASDLVAEILAYPKDINSYGLIHYDIHPWNFLIDGDIIKVFDFDDCLYGWFALDIGIALYHGLWWGRKNDAGRDFSDELIGRFIRGYLSENQLDDYWLSKIPVFMKFRQICKLSWFYAPGGGDDHQKERIRNIENGALFSDFTPDPRLFSHSN
jgi:Ser/Thr protein kinase RdoA (MazF antagonist)